MFCWLAGYELWREASWLAGSCLSGLVTAMFCWAAWLQSAEAGWLAGWLAGGLVWLVGMVQYLALVWAVPGCFGPPWTVSCCSRLPQLRLRPAGSIPEWSAPSQTVRDVRGCPELSGVAGLELCDGRAAAEPVWEAPTGTEIV